ALDLGPITLTGATVRLTFSAGSVDVELRGFGAAVEIPGVLKGGGKIAVAPNGTVGGQLDVDIIPAGIHALGGLTPHPAPLFATGIPLGGTGLALYGLLRKFVANGKPNLNDLTDPDPIKRELQWFAKPAIQKYVAANGQWAIGLGAVVGPLPDGGFTFNAVG